MIVQNAEDENIYNEEKIVRDATALSGTLYFSQALYIARGFIIANVLGPATYGVWSIFRSFFASSPYFGLGTQQAMLREVPFSLGEGNKLKKSIIVQTTLSWNILLTSLVMVLAVIISFTKLAAEYGMEIRLAGILFVLNAIHLFMRPKFKSEQKILLLSKYMLSYAVLNTFFGLSLLFFFRLNGLLMGMIIAQLILFSYLIINKHLSLNLFIDKIILKELLRIGFPIMILWLLIFLIGNVDKFIVFTMLGKTKAGYYGLAAFISSIVSYISYTISSVIFPRMMYVYGKTGEKRDIEKYFTKPMIILSGFVPVILGIIYINIEIVIHFFLPQYIPGIKVLHILIISIFFSTIWGLPANLLIAFNKQKKFMYMTVCTLILSIALDFLAIENRFDMSGVAVVTTFTFFLASITANGYALFSLEKNLKQIIKSLSVIYFPFIYLAAVMFIVIFISPSTNTPLNNVFKTIVFVILSLPLILYIEKKSNIILKIFSSLKTFRK